MPPGRSVNVSKRPLTLSVRAAILETSNQCLKELKFTGFSKIIILRDMSALQATAALRH